jgi:hypothetical protein
MIEIMYQGVVACTVAQSCSTRMLVGLARWADWSIDWLDLWEQVMNNIYKYTYIYTHIYIQIYIYTYIYIYMLNIGVVSA